MKALHILLRLALPLLIIGAGLLSWNALKDSPKDSSSSKSGNLFIKNPSTQQIVKEQKNSDEPVGHPVVANPMELTSYQVLIPSRGESVSGDETEIIAETEGKVQSVSPQFEVGSFIKEDEILLQLNQEDLRADVSIAEARVAQAEATLAQEKAQAEQALLNWNDIGYDEAPGDLVLRKPQLKQAEATLKSAKAQVEKEQRELERSIIRAPYDGVIAERVVSIGQKLTRGKIIGKIISTEYAEISLPVSAQHEVFLPAEIKNTAVAFTNPLVSDDSLSWEGFITTREPQVDENTKQLHLRGRINDPYQRAGEGKPLPIGQPVTAQITGKTLEDVYIVPKSALRDADMIHIATPEKTLQLHTIAPIWTDNENIIFKADLPDGSAWVETVIRRGINGMQLEFIKEELKEEVATKPAS